MAVREFEHAYRCPGCDTVLELKTCIDQWIIDQHRNPAPLIATEKMATEREAAKQHARKGCPRPV